MNGLKTIINKELNRVFKDKKMIFSMFVLPIILVGGIFLLVFTLISNMIPVAIILQIAWIIFVILWMLSGIPIGPGVGVALPAGVL